MFLYSLQRVPNQKFSIIVEGHLCEFSLHTVNSLWMMNLSVDGEDIIHSLVCVPDSWLIPFRHQHIGWGNFRFECSNEEYPSYSNIGETCNLYYYDADEFEAAESLA